MNTTLPLTLNYDFSPNTVLYDPDFGHKLDRMRAAGVSSVWLGGFFYGRWEASPEDIARAISAYVQLFDRLLKGYLSGDLSAKDVELAYRGDLRGRGLLI